ncbi:4-(cytidine 5'-diphospho)-2-C-methyl-D-erythritol kinase, partial [Tsukamurella sp. 8F]|nr:4-(cytidine 5'-diphospho)-2-C-methyl-D-erythritol kinase [Tsukamurella sp. 8F]
MLSVVPEPVSARAYAKVNLHLAVGDLRADGYHELTTVFQSLSLHDDVTLRAGAGAVAVGGEGAADVPADATNLAARAVRALAERHGVGADVDVTIAKGIPVAGGMAGGSADAAAALVAA